MTKRFTATALLLSILLCCASAFASFKPFSQVGSDVSGFSSSYLDGSAADGSIFAEHPVSVVTYWATWSGACQSEMPFYQQLYETGDEIGVFGLLHEDGTSTVSSALALLNANGCGYPVFVTDSVWTGITSQSSYIPQTFFVDENGVIVEARTGVFTSYQQLAERVSYWISVLAPETYTVTFVDGIDGSIIRTVTDVPYGASVEAPIPPAHAGYTFATWSTNEYTYVTCSLEVTARYVRNQFRVRFLCPLDNNAVLSTQYVYYGDAATAPVPHTHAGYTFVGWSVSFSYITSELDVYAVYEADAHADGDVNCDGAVNSADALLALRISLGLEQPTSANITHGDINGSGSIDSADALSILRTSLGLSVVTVLLTDGGLTEV